MLTIILQAGLLFVKASLYSIAYTILIEREYVRRNLILTTLSSFLILFAFSKVNLFLFNSLSKELISLIAIAFASASIFSIGYKKSIFYYILILILSVKASIYTSYLSIFLHNKALPLMDISSINNIIFMVFNIFLLYINILIIKKCIHNYNSLSSKVSFSMYPFLFTNTIILFINFSINLYGYIVMKEHLILGSFTLKLSVISLVFLIEILLLTILKLYNLLMRNNIQLTLVKDIADNDALTGVLSREKGLSILKSKILTSKKSNSSLTICFIDINNLKKVNDSYGHEEGDRLIELVSSTVKNKLRKYDVICRLGGDEFLVVFDSCSLIEAQKSWNRIEREISKLNTSSEFKFCISVSVGFAQYNKRIHTTIKSLIKEADDEMYRQKKINKFYEKVNDTQN